MGPRVLLHTEEGWLEGGEPLLEIGARDPVHVVEALERVERAVTKGYTAVGFVAYEAAGGLWDRFVTHEPAPGLPLVWFALYDTLSPSLGPPPVNHGAPPIDGWEPSLDLESYRERIAAIRELIAAGETYQVNFTLRLRAPWEAQDPLQLFARLCEAQPSRYAAFLDTGRFALCSGSPELFYRREGTSILCNPMKGTAPRGRYGAEGARNAEWLRTDE
ncbi:MAG TPA: chorismate-binding protein, partial [bacterium]|nr:chorismate-binding protein [bacterium]